MPRSIDRAPLVILPVGRPGAIPRATRPELKYEKGQTRAVNMWQWTRSVCSPIQATCPRVATERMVCAPPPALPTRLPAAPSRRYARIEINRPRIVSDNLLSSSSPTTAKDRQANRPASASRRKRRSLGHRRCPDLSYSGPACVADCHVPHPPQGLHLSRLAPNLAPRRQNGSRYSHAELRPE
jgi:hypothetical protein